MRTTALLLLLLRASACEASSPAEAAIRLPLEARDNVRYFWVTTQAVDGLLQTGPTTMYFSEASMTLPLPASNLRSNVGTWPVPTCCLPAVAHFLHDVLPNEFWDPHFMGQELETTYFDTPSFHLRKARKQGVRYLTLRIRCYAATDQEEVYAISAKTEAEKWRQEIPALQAEGILHGDMSPGFLLPTNLLARLQELTGDDPVVGVVKVCCRRYAVENADDRFTLDIDVRTDRGKRLPFAVLEHKSTDPDAAAPAALQALRLRPMKLSKFLWATSP